MAEFDLTSLKFSFSIQKFPKDYFTLAKFGKIKFKGNPLLLQLANF